MTGVDDRATARPRGRPRLRRRGTGRLEPVELGPFELEDGTTLPALTVAYRHDGPAAGGGAADRRRPRAHRLGRRRRRLVGAADRPGPRARHRSRTASSAPTCSAVATARPARRRSIRATGRPYGAAFPVDHDARPGPRPWRLLDALGVDGVALVVGGSLGGMVALEVALERPRVGRHGRADRGAGRDRRDGRRLEPPPGPAHRPARRRWPGARSPAGDDHLPERGRLRRALRTRPASRTAGRRSSATSTTRAASSSTGSTRRPTGSSPARWTATTSASGRGGLGRRARATGAAAGTRLDRRRDRGRHPRTARARSGRSSTAAAAAGVDAPLSRDPLDQGPRRVPGRMGPAHVLLRSALDGG